MIELWLVDLERAAPALQAQERAQPRLSSDDRTRALQILDPRERRHRLAAYVALRAALERMAGREVRGAAFVRARSGKPRLAQGQATFSLSHSDGFALIGVARRGEIGVDLECARTVRVSTHRRRLIVAAGAGLAGTSLGEESAADAAFLQAWSRLEAFAKARGSGLARMLADLGARGSDARAIAPSRVEAAARRLSEETRLQTYDLSLPSGLHGAVAIEHSLALPPVRSFPVDSAAIERLLALRARPRRPS
jgi:4'-phosphopantetheinyl transferase